MKAILFKKPGPAKELYIGEVEMPVISSKEILVEVKAAGINRADILQREGHYPPPPGSSPVLGLEISGEIVETGDGVTKWKAGDRVFGLLSGGGYAQYAALHEDMAMPVPETMDYANAAGIPEVFLTAFQSLFWLGKIREQDQVLIHAGASGVGTAAIQLARSKAADVIATASSGKHQLCKELGARHVIDYKKGPFVEELMDETNGKGVNLILDPVGGTYFSQNLKVLQTDGRLVMISVMGGYKLAEVDLRPIIFKRLEITGSTLRSRSKTYQIALTRDFWELFGEKVQSGILHPVIDTIFDWNETAEAHRYMEANLSAGKVILKISP